MYSQWQNFDFVKQNRKKLIVTIGESWTWGDSLGKTQHTKYDDKEFRLANVYGGKLAEKLNADFLNIAEPGQSNLWIANHFKLFMNNINDFLYDEIIVIITLTEVGREFNGDLDSTRDYMLDLKDISNLSNFLSTLSSYVANDILSVDADKINLLIGTNFIDSNYPKNLNVLEASWIDIIANKLHTSITKPCYVVSSWVFDRFYHLLEFSQKYKREDFLKDMLTHMEIAKQITNFLLASKFNYNKASKHPTPEGHLLWANYLYDTLNIRYGQ